MQILPNNIFGGIFILLGIGMAYASYAVKSSGGEKCFNLCQGVKQAERTKTMGKVEAIGLVSRYELEASVLFLLTGFIVQFMGKPLYFSVVCFGCLGWLNYRRGMVEHLLKGGVGHGKKHK